MKIVYSRHARRQMKWRRISTDEVEEAIINPEDETPSIKGRFNMWGQSGGSRLKVTVLKEVESIVVDTVIRKR